MDEDKLEQLMKLLEHLERPGASMRSAVGDLQQGELPDTEKMGQAWDQPDTAPTGYDIAEGTGISDEYPNVKAALATAVDLADPVDLTMMGGATKLGKHAMRGVKKIAPAMAAGSLLNTSPEEPSLEDKARAIGLYDEEETGQPEENNFKRFNKLR